MPPSPHTNHLAGSASPYLLQHQHNPVDWYPWGDEALQKARKENKPILISIGYSACHWCHVMERESFENESIAELMNRYFICIKVDREEHPDVDHLYMTAVQMIHGNGGWPLNAFALPDGRPFYGGTYFPPEQWRALLTNISGIYQNEFETVESQAKQITQGIEVNNVIQAPKDDQALTPTIPEEIFRDFAKTFDPEHGGSKGAPKFPLPLHWQFLLRYAALNHDTEALDHLHLTLQSMASGGIFDHVGGGFSRYSVDKEWHVPHFEKMLYDNAQLISLYAEAYHHLDKPEYKSTAVRSIQFLQNELRQESGLYSSALDADSEGVEGKYYVWTSAELEDILGDDAPLFEKAFGIDGHSLWEGGWNVLRRTPDETEVLRESGLTKEEYEKTINEALQKLQVARHNRVRPGLDDKVLCSWNAMTVKALATAGLAFNDDHLRREAEELIKKVLNAFSDGKDGLHHAWKEGKAYIPGYLEDYAFTIDALITLHQATLREEHLLSAEKLLNKTLELFYDEASRLFWFSREDDDKLPARKMETMDSVTPSSNAVMATNLYRLGRLLEYDGFIKKAEGAMEAMLPTLRKYPSAHLAWASFLLTYTAPIMTVFVTGPQSQKKADELLRKYDPALLIATNDGSSGIDHLRKRYDQEKTEYYVCTHKECLPPSEEIPVVISDRLKAMPKVV